MHATRRIPSPIPGDYCNDPTTVTPMPAKVLNLRPPAANDVKTDCILGPNASLESQGLSMPRVGDLFLGFKIVDKLGEGGFGSVFLAEQLGLAGRPVALKFTSRPNHEPERLASLQHTNIVPVYSVHTMPPIQVLCMPYLGRQTLHDVLQIVSETKMLPATGAGLLSTVNAFKPDTKKRSSKTKPFENNSPGPKSGGVRAALPRPQPVRELLGRLSFPDSVVWLFTRLAEALAHAHERGILHLDLKPSNVLVTDDGVPMILDFGLAHDVNSGRYDQSGGTLRYMSPEQLESYGEHRGISPDVRMDLYSLGVMFYELLTGQHPFERSMESGLSMGTILLARRDFAPRLRTLNPNISPAVESIVLKLLNPDAENRYQTAAELLTDLTLHQENRPLKFTRNPSFVERLRKYRRRHPVQAVVLVAAALALTTFGASGAAIQQSRQRTTAESTIQAGRLHEAVPGLRIDLTTMEHRSVRAEALAKVEVWFGRYDVTANSKWLDHEGVRRLTDADRGRLTHEIGELALLCGHAERLNAFTGVGGEKSAAYERALRWNRIAENCYDSGWLPPAVSEQRVRLGAELNRIELAEEINSALCTAEGPLEFYLRGLNLLTEGRYAGAADAFETLVDRDPGHAGGQFALATSYQYAGRYTEAAERFQLAKALAPLDPRPALYRGLLLSFLKKYAEASKEFTVAIQRDPRNSPAYYHRAISEAQLENLPAAIADATKSLELGEPNYRTLMLRASFLNAKGDTAAAARDRVAAGELVLLEEADLTARGNTKLRLDPEGALADYVKAADVNPLYFPAWQNQAHVLGERLNKPHRAVACLDRALELNPGCALAIVGRAVVHARLGKSDEARNGAELAVKQSGDPFVLYQVACVYALISKAHPEEAKVALDHLRVALRKKYSDFDTIAKDSDLDAIRDSEEFKLIVDSAKEMKAK